MFNDHFKDVAHAIWEHRVWEAIKGMWKSKRANIAFIVVLAILLGSAAWYDYAQSRKEDAVRDAMVTKITDNITSTLGQKLDKIIEIIDYQKK